MKDVFCLAYLFRGCLVQSDHHTHRNIISLNRQAQHVNGRDFCRQINKAPQLALKNDTHDLYCSCLRYCFPSSPPGSLHSLRLRLKDLVRDMFMDLWGDEPSNDDRPEGCDVDMDGPVMGDPVFSWSFSAFRLSTVLWGDKSTIFSKMIAMGLSQSFLLEE